MEEKPKNASKRKRILPEENLGSIKLTGPMLRSYKKSMDGAAKLEAQDDTATEKTSNQIQQQPIA